MKFDESAFGFEFILGSVYIPHESSKYFTNDIFDEDDVVNVKSRFSNIPICLVGDFNSRTGILDDFITFVSDVNLNEIPTDVLVDSKADLTSSGFNTERYNLDKHVNKNGSRLIELCKNLDIHIINGRFGDDLKQGNLTCDSAKLIDNVIASPSLFSKMFVR